MLDKSLMIRAIQPLVSLTILKENELEVSDYQRGMQNP